MNKNTEKVVWYADQLPKQKSVIVSEVYLFVSSRKVRSVVRDWVLSIIQTSVAYTYSLYNLHGTVSVVNRAFCANTRTIDS